MNNETALKQKIMRRVYGVYLLKKVTGVEARTVLTLAALGVLSLTVSVPHVIQNMPALSNPIAVAQFFVSAMIATHAFVKVLIVIGSMLFVWTSAGLIETLVRARPRVSA